MDDKLIATFYAYDPDTAFQYLNAGLYHAALSAIRERVRTWRKHGHNFKTADAALDEVYAVIIDEMQGLED